MGPDASLFLASNFVGAKAQISADQPSRIALTF